MSQQFYDPAMYEYPILGAALLDDSLVSIAADIVGPEDFQCDEVRYLWSAALELKRAGQAVDVITVSDQADVPIYTCAEIAQNTPSPNADSVRTYAGIVRDKARLQRLRHALQKAAEEASEQDADVESIAAKARDYLITLDSDSQTAKRSIKDILRERVDAFERRYSGEESAMGIATGLAELDAMTFGLKPSEMILLAARPGMGKSTLALKLAEQAACKQGKRVAFFSLEMSNDETIDRLLVQKAGINSGAFNDPANKGIEPHEISRIGPCVTEILESDLHIFDDIFTIEGIVSKCRALHQQKPLDLIVIDYLQLITSKSASKYGSNRTQEVGDYSRAIKMLAMALQAPVVALSQLNREVEKRPDKRPLMADLRESGSLEQDANKIFMLYIDEVYNEQTDQRGIAEVIVRKNRGGSIGTVKTAVDLSRYSFTNFAPDRYVQQAQAAGVAANPFA